MNTQDIENKENKLEEKVDNITVRSIREFDYSDNDLIKLLEKELPNMDVYTPYGIKPLTKEDVDAIINFIDIENNIPKGIDRNLLIDRIAVTKVISDVLLVFNGLRETDNDDIVNVIYYISNNNCDMSIWVTKLIEDVLPFMIVNKLLLK